MSVDLSEAFGTINYRLLLAKLETFPAKSLKFLQSYLSKRFQQTHVNYSLSNWAEISASVLQGSILGPLLFNIFLDDMFLLINTNNLKLQKMIILVTL